jgi:Protein of unknown function (DUF3168)
MSYGVAAALQASIYQRLTGQLTGVAVFDAPPAGGGKGTFVLIGPEEALDASDKTGGGAEHRLIVSVISDKAGFLDAKAVAVRVSDALIRAPLVPTRGRVVSIGFIRAVARRLADGEARRIDMTFRARVED